MTTRYPLDFENLQKGDLVSVKQIEQITGFKCGTDEYRWGMIALQARIETEMALRGVLVTVKGFNNDLKILTDSEAALYNTKRFYNGLRGLQRVYCRKVSVDVTNLTVEEKQKHERDLVNQSRYIQAVDGVSRIVSIEPYKRLLPQYEKEEI